MVAITVVTPVVALVVEIVIVPVPEAFEPATANSAIPLPSVVAVATCE